MLQKILTGAFYLLFLVTPLIFTSYNHELFEYNKMMFVYAMTIVVMGAWAAKMVHQRQLILNWTPISWPMLAFLVATVASTVTSIDPHTSIWGYYTRSNGGLLSVLAYTVLFTAMVSNFEAKQVRRFLNIALLGGLIVALYAIPEHFGVSPSCILLYGQATASCWVQDVQARVFATLGQPNWLAAYLAMLIFPALAFYTLSDKLKSKVYYGAVAAIMYMAMTFAYSRGATLGIIGGLAVVIGLSGWQWWKKPGAKSKRRILIKELVVILAVFGVINIFFGSALTRFQLINMPQSADKTAAPGVTQLENGGTESGTIRLIVWQGALEIFKHYPLLGSGPETFAYSYYQFRPQAHNLVSEWDFLYNKAHNEYLNYLATTGIVGFGTYMWLVLAFIWWSFQQWRRSEKPAEKMLVLAMLGAVISFLIQNIFGFSVVVIALFFYLFPAMSMIETGSVKKMALRDLRLGFVAKWLEALIDRRALAKTIIAVTLTVIALATVYGLLSIARLWLADTLFARGSNYSDAGNPGQAYNYLGEAVFFNTGEPLYRSELGYAASSAALALADQDATLSGQLKAEGELLTDQVLAEHPKNVSFFRTAIRSYYELAGLDPKFNQITLETFDKTIALAPTDAKLYFNKAVVQDQLNQPDEAIKTLQQAIELKPNYREAYLVLGGIYAKQDQKDKALEQFKTVLELVPNDPEATAAIQKLK